MGVMNVRGLSKAYGPQTLFDGLDFVIEEGEKVGLIGRNGSGKTTLFEILSGQTDPDAGQAELRRGANFAYLSQEPHFGPEATPRSVVSDALSGLREALERFETLSLTITSCKDEALLDSLLIEQAEVQTTIDRLGGWTWEHQVEDVLGRLKIPDSDLDRPMNELSGGQRRRVGLARALLNKPDFLILDEPTNHLDADTIEWLEETLQQFPGALLLVTHDRYFLERCVTRILELDRHGLRSYPGAYQEYMRRKLEFMNSLEKAEERRVKILSRELEWLARGPKARSTKQKARIKNVEVLQAAKVKLGDADMQLEFQADDRLGGIILEARGLRKRFDDLTVLDGVSLSLRRDDKVGIVGPNGCGKTTLLAALQRQITLDGGEVVWGKNTRPAYLDQARSGLDEDATVFDAVLNADEVRIGARKIHKNTWLKEFLFDYNDQRKLVSSLSGGERCRLLLAKLIAENANLLILDEPTNDLDIASLQVLEDALVAFKGCVILVTHDRYFMNRVCEAILAFDGREVTRFDGDYDFYRSRRDAEKALQRQLESKATPKPSRKSAEKTKVRTLTYAERLELADIESRVEAADTEVARLEALLSEPSLYKDRPTEVATTRDALEAAKREVESVYARWEELEALKPDA